jgi:hypothetical protein
MDGDPLHDFDHLEADRSSSTTLVHDSMLPCDGSPKFDPRASRESPRRIKAVSSREYRELL